ncbi:MAG: aldehyde dehydrogenase family protein [Acidimicrobiales bacterium]
MTIDGKSVDAPCTLDVDNPASGLVFAHAPECSHEQLDTAMVAAERALVSWRRDEVLRQSCLARLADAVEAQLSELSLLITSEEGKPLIEARSEVSNVAANLRYFAGMSLVEESIYDDREAQVSVVRKPIGVVAAITPWNFPLGTAIAKIAPALAAGCSVVLKPSPFAPLSCLELGRLAQDIVPPGVLNVVSGGDQVGAWMSKHPVPRLVSFTGSVRTGKEIVRASADDLKVTLLELGGNDPAIVLDDVDPEEVGRLIYDHAFGNCGQVCVAVKRVYVPEEIVRAVTASLAERARAAIVGDGALAGTEIGPLINDRQRKRVAELVSDARSRGAHVVAGGETIDGPGYFFAPTIITDVADGVRIVDEEQFGPVLPIIAYKDVEDAVARANQGHFGLGGSVWGRDVEAATEIARRLDTGTAWVNAHREDVLGQPSGGTKWSGIGVEGGRLGLLAYTEIQSVYVARGH